MLTYPRAGYGFGWAPAFSLTASEICPTRTRGTIVTLAFTYQNLLNFAITRAFPNMTQDMHAYGPLALFAAFTFVGVLWVYLAFPECKGRPMETMDSLFDVPWYKVGRASTGKASNMEVGIESNGMSRHITYDTKDAPSSLHL